jgi:hypothetical protein
MKTIVLNLYDLADEILYRYFKEYGDKAIAQMKQCKTFGFLCDGRRNWTLLDDITDMVIAKENISLTSSQWYELDRILYKSEIIIDDEDRITINWI